MSTTPLKGYEYTFFNTTSPSPGVAHVEINRPSKLNAFSEPVWLEFGKLFDQISADSDIRAVVLTASGEKAFTAGLDVQAASQSDNAVFGEKGKGDVARRAKGLRAHIEEFQSSIAAVERCEKRKFYCSCFARAGELTTGLYSCHLCLPRRCHWSSHRHRLLHRHPPRRLQHPLLCQRSRHRHPRRYRHPSPPAQDRR